MKTIIFLFVLMFSLVLNTFAQGITIGSGTTFSLGSATLTLPNNWINSGTFNAQNGTVILNGSTGNQTITNASGETFNNLTVNKSSGTVVLNNNITTNGTLTITSSDLDLNGNIITLGGSATMSETTGNTVKGTSGYITTTRTLTAPNISTNIAGMGISIGSTANLGSTVITRGHAAQSGNSNEGILRYFDITPTTNTGLNATLKFCYDESELNGLTESNLDLYRFDISSSAWEDMAGALDISLNTLTATNLEHCSKWTAGTDLAPSAGSDTLYLSAAWNLVSVPRIQTNDSAEVVFPGKYGAMFGYDQVLGDYVEAPTLEVGLGYWVYYIAADTIVINGAAEDTVKIKCKRGWNLIGSNESDVAVADLDLSAGSIYGSVFYYNPSIGDYVETTVIVTGRGNWIYVTEDCELRIP